MTEPTPPLADFATLAFDDTFLRQLPGETPPPEIARRSREVRGACWAAVDPAPVAAPRIVAWSPEAGALLGVGPPESDTGLVAQVLGGNRPLPGMRPYAACYGGHQFGHWAGQLGDGRAITLGETLGADARRWEVQLKGSGPTAFSRRSDGRAVLRSSLREFLCSEAMHHLGVPTTRALALTTTGESVVRDMFYDGRARPEPGAIVTRLAPTFVRLGNFEIFASRGETEPAQALLRWLLTHHFPDLNPGPPDAPLDDDTLVAFFGTVCERTARLMSDWMHVGFVHGVMNTDNLSVLGLTIDYGPYGFLDTYDPDFTPNTTDYQSRRYRYANQPEVAQWNLYRFAMALSPLAHEPQRFEAALSAFVGQFETHWRGRMADRLGVPLGVASEADSAFLDTLLGLLGRVETDPTIFFRRLIDVSRTDVSTTDVSTTEADLVAPLADAFYDRAASPAEDADLRAAWAAWLRDWRTRFDAESEPAEVRRARMRARSPAVIPRNYLAQQAIDAAEQGDFGPLSALLDACRRPYEETPENARYREKRPEWARDKPGCSALSCSS